MNWEANFLNFKNRTALASLRANEKRQKSFDKFVSGGLPSTKEEAWKFTGLSEFKKIQWMSHEEDEANLTHEQMQEVSKNLPSDFLNFVFVNGELNKTLSDDAENLFSIGEVEEKDFEFNDRDTENKILNLAQAFVSKKIELQLPKHKIIEKPVQILFVQSSKNSVYLSEKLNINLGENSEMKLLINSISFINSNADAMNLNVHICVENSARLNFVQLQNEDMESFHFSQCKIDVHSHAKLLTFPLTLGNRISRNYLNIQFNGIGARAEAYGLAVIDQSQHADNYTFIQHSVGQNESIQHYKSILSGESHSVFRGRVLIEPNAQKANSAQLNNNLLLTRSAQVDTVPQLEIFADDVKASHGATVGQLNKEEIFYFLSRGIDQHQAVKILSYGFATELVYKIENKDLQNYLIAALNKKLERMVQNA